MKRGLIALGAALALAGCGDKAKSTADDKICLTPPSIGQGDWRACIHTWAYRLAGAPDSSKVIAEAVIEGCRGAIEFNKGKEEFQQAKAQSFNLALFHVVQARAGRCYIP